MPSSLDLLTVGLDHPVAGLLDNKPFITSATFNVNDPHNIAKKLHSAYGANEEEAIKAVESAHKALEAWRETSIKFRREIYLRAVGIIKQRREEFIAIELRETTSSIPMANLDIGLTLDALEELASAVSSALRGEVTASEYPGQTGHILREPYGVVLGMAPWNAPMTLGFRAVSNAIIAGNTCVLKTSEFSPLTHNIVGQVFVDAGLPPGVLNIVHVSAKDAPKVAEALIAHPHVRKVNFTGSTRVGSIIGSLCGKYIKPVILELGGAAPVVVLPDADLSSAVSHVVFGGLFHSGQICMSTNTLIVHEDIVEDVVSRLKEALQGVTAGKDLGVGDEKTGKGQKLRGLFNTGSANRVRGLVNDAVGKGAKVVAGLGVEKNEDTNVVHPVVLDGVTADMDIYHQEIFGPAIGIVHFKTDEEAIALANGSEYGLSAAVHSRDIERAMKIAKRITAGLVHINSFTIHDHATLPHGGTKSSGFGRFNGFEGIREFTQFKVITVNDIGHAPPI